VFVLFSLNQNTAAIHGAMESALFERHSDLADHAGPVADRGSGEKFSKACWVELKYGLDPTFWRHVGPALFETAQ
jgi:hypothetical protein